MFYYKTYNLCIRSDIELPLFNKADFIQEDVSIIVDYSIGAKNSDKTVLYESLPDGLFFQAKNIGSFLISGGTKIHVCPDSKADMGILRQCIYGNCMAAILRHRDYCVFHGNAFTLNNRGVLVLGKKGAGKSSLTAAFAEMDCPVISDDISAATRNDDGEYSIVPGPKILKLWPDVMAALDIKKKEYPTISPLVLKHFVACNPEPEIMHKIPLKTIVVLEFDDVLKFKKLEGSEKFLRVSNELFFSGLKKNVNRKADISEFEQCADIVKKIDAICLSRPNNLKFLSRSAMFLTEVLTDEI